jgi:hypothetical protein
MQTPESTEKKDTEYTLTPEERKAFQGMNMAVLVARAAIYDANLAVEKAQAAAREAVERASAAEQHFQGALNLLATAHGMDGAQLTPDMTTLRRA